jgi:DNA-directed RNA polymerase sigma subunit (sigma70/sigma32)
VCRWVMLKMMDGRLSGSDYSLNATQSTDEEGREWIETLEDESEGADSLFEQAHDNAHLRKCLLDALSTLNDRERLNRTRARYSRGYAHAGKPWKRAKPFKRADPPN